MSLLRPGVIKQHRLKLIKLRMQWILIYGYKEVNHWFFGLCYDKNLQYKGSEIDFQMLGITIQSYAKYSFFLWTDISHYHLWKARPPLRVSKFTHTYPHKPIKKTKVAICYHQAGYPYYMYLWPDVWFGELQSQESVWYRPWCWMSILRPGNFKQH